MTHQRKGPGAGDAEGLANYHNEPKNYSAESIGSQAEFVAFTIPGEPVAFARSGGNGKIRFTPKRQRDFMALAKLAAAKAMAGAPPMSGPLRMAIRASYIVPSSWTKKRRDAARWRTARPDADNVAKLVADAINSIVYEDDAQIAALEVQEIYGPVAGVTVAVSSLEEAAER